MRIRRVQNITRNPISVQDARFTNASTTYTLHLFRALLRECTYLPDPNSREFFHAHVVSRFRAYCPRPSTNKRQRFKKKAIILERGPRLLKKAQASLRYLCRANYGHPKQLSWVLAMTYGRIGPRRHELLKGLKVHDTPASTSGLEDVLQQRTEPANQFVPQPSQQFMALIRSQAQQNNPLISRKTLKQTKPVIPEKNGWGRPTPINRIRNLKRRWYAETLDRVMPPLSESEWESLRRRTCSETPFPGPIPRRGPSGEQNIGLVSYKSGSSITRPHNLNGRYMRRLWGKIFQQCPMMQKNSSCLSGWKTIWPDLRKGVGIGLQLDTISNRGLFDGVDEHGKVSAPAFS